MPLEPLKVGTASIGQMPTQGTENATPTQKSGAATFFKGIGKQMASL